MRYFLFYIGLAISMASCQSAGFQADTAPVDQSLDPQAGSPDLSSAISVQSIRYEGNIPLIIRQGDTLDLTLTAELSNGETISGITGDNDYGHLIWFVNNQTVVNISPEGKLTALKEGLTSFIATLGNASTQVSVIVDKPLAVQVETPPPPPTAPPPARVYPTRIQFTLDQLTLKKTKSALLTLKANYSNGTQKTGPISQLVTADDCTPSFIPSYADIAQITASGEITATKIGSTVVMFFCGNFSDQLTFIVKPLRTRAPGEIPGNDESTPPDDNTNPPEEPVDEAPENPQDPQDDTPDPVEEPETPEPPTITTEPALQSADYFLSENDIITINYGTNGGFGSTWFPDIVYSTPWTGGTDVVSVGKGGSLEIELKNYIIADGDGIDFTLFENPAHYAGFPLYAERAQVFVKENAEDAWTAFDCDADDTVNQVYAGCMGVNMIDALANPFDPLASGGDQFDLAQVGLRYARFIKILDLSTCVPGDPTYQWCTYPGTSGFDLDAMIILNGINE